MLYHHQGWGEGVLPDDANSFTLCYIWIFWFSTYVSVHTMYPISLVFLCVRLFCLQSMSDISVISGQIVHTNTSSLCEVGCALTRAVWTTRCTRSRFPDTMMKGLCRVHHFSGFQDCGGGKGGSKVIKNSEQSRKKLGKCISSVGTTGEMGGLRATLADRTVACLCCLCRDICMVCSWRLFLHLMPFLCIASSLSCCR